MQDAVDQSDGAQEAYRRHRRCKHAESGFCVARPVVRVRLHEQARHAVLLPQRACEIWAAVAIGEANIDEREVWPFCADQLARLTRRVRWANNLMPAHAQGPGQVGCDEEVVLNDDDAHIQPLDCASLPYSSCLSEPSDARRPSLLAQEWKGRYCAGC